MNKTMRVSLKASAVLSQLRSNPPVIPNVGAAAYGTTTVEAGTLKTATVTFGGEYYSSAPSVTVYAGAGGGSLGTVTATINGALGQVNAFAITALGTEYTGAPGLTCSGGRGSVLTTPMIELGD